MTNGARDTEVSLPEEPEVVEINLTSAGPNGIVSLDNKKNKVTIAFGKLFRSQDDSVKVRLGQLEAFAKEHGGEGVANFALELFPEIAEKREQANGEAHDALPTTAPELYGGLRGPETPPEFVSRVYAPWLGQGLTRAHIRQLDPPLYQAITNWSRKPGNRWPANVDLPTLKDQNSRWVERLESEGMAAVVQDGPADAVLREARRLAGIKHRRSKDQQRT